MLTEREEMIVRYLRREADREEARADAVSDHELSVWHDGSRHGCAMAADAIEAGKHLRRPSPTIPAEEWLKKPSCG